MLLRRLSRRCALGLAVPLGIGPGACPSSRVGSASYGAFRPLRIYQYSMPLLAVLRWRLPAAFDTALVFPPLVNNRPLSEGAAGVSRLGGRVGTRTIPSGFALTICKSPPCACALGGLAVLFLTRFQGGDDLVLRGHALAFGVLGLEIAAQVAGGLGGEQFYQGQGQDVRCQKHPVRLP